MVERLQVYKCNVCGNMVEVIHASKGTLSCCGQDMALMTENTVDAAKEKHVPEIVKDGNNVTVKVGSVSHPMEEKHYIEWIQLLVGEKAYRKFLAPGEEPVATFIIDEEGDVASREYCNLHGLWKA